MSSRDPDEKELREARAPARRIVRLMVLYGVVAAAALGLFSGSFEASAILTATVVLSIVNFRGLEAQTRILAPTSDGKLGLSSRLLILLRITLIILLIVLALRSFSGHRVAILLGLASLPVALFGETALQSASLLREGSHGRRR